MASVHANSIAPQSFLSIPKPKSKPSVSHQKPISTLHFGGGRRVRCDPSIELGQYGPAGRDGGELGRRGRCGERVGESGGRVRSERRENSFEGGAEFQGFGSGSGVGEEIERRESGEIERLIDRTSNGTIVLAAGTYAITRLLTIDQDYWHCFEEKPLFVFDRA